MRGKVKKITLDLVLIMKEPLPVEDLPSLLEKVSGALDSVLSTESEIQGYTLTDPLSNYSIHRATRIKDKETPKKDEHRSS